MAECVIWAAEKLVEFSIGPIVNQFKYLWCYRRNIQNLRDELQALEDKRKDLLHKVESAERNAQDIRDGVKAWLENVDNKKKEAIDVLNNTTANSLMQWQCLKCPNLKHRYSNGRKATKITTTILELKNKGSEFQTVGYPKQSTQFPTQVHNVEGLESRITTKNEIVEAIKGEETFIVGICGMPGVGKTTMAKEIANEVNKYFNDVAFVVVSKEPTINKVQDHIAEALGQKIEEDNEEVRARRLYDRLMYNTQKKILVILDDVWEEVNLEKIGFPPKGARKGLKILLTSRFQKACRKMGADRIVEVKVLPENEALKLLKDAAGISNDTSEVVKDLAALVANECGGLPLSLVVIGKALIDEEEYSWRDTLRQLQNSIVTEEDVVYKSIEISYNKLKPEGVKSLFLLCSLFPEDYNISVETLVRYARGLEMFRDTTTLSETRDRVYSVVAHLKSCYLLLSGFSKGEVKLHDVMRDFCLLITSRGKDVYIAKHNGVGDWPKHDKDDPHTAISLTFDDQLKELPSGLEYPNLNLLRVVCQYNNMHIPSDFFSKMNQLKVVDFRSSLFNHIPSSLQSLTNLQTLCLDACELYIGLSTIGSLKKVEILSFFESRVSEFPIEIAQLSNLKLLDLRFHEFPHPLPSGTLSSLNELEELYLGVHFTTGEDGRGDLDQVEKEHIIGELSSLKGLKTFQVCVNDPRFLLKMLEMMHLEKLQRFQIICTEKFIDNEYHIGRSVHLEKLEASEIKESIRHDSILSRTDDLLLENVVGSLKNLVSELDETGFVDLKTLTLSRCSFEYLIETTELSLSPTSAFSKLEQLSLDDLSNLKGIYNGNLPANAFARLETVILKRLPCIEHLWRGDFKPPFLCNLRKFYMRGCHVIKSLFPESGAKCLLNLKSVSVNDCEMLENIVSRDAMENEVTDEMLEFKKLQDLEICNLNNLKSFRSQSSVDFEQLFNQVAFPNLETLVVQGLHNIAKILGDDIQPKALEKLRSVDVSACGDLTNIAQSDTIKFLQNLECLEVYDCEELYVLFECEGLKVTKDETRSILPRLTSMELTLLPKLVHIANRVPKGIHAFQNLTSLEIGRCHSLRYLFTPCMASSLIGLETLRLEDCGAIKEIIAREEEIGMAEPTFIDKLVFPKLSTLKLIQLQSLRMFCSENIKLVFPSLDEIVVHGCGEMVKFSSQHPIALKVKTLRIAKVTLSSQTSWIQDTFPNLEELRVHKVDCVSKTLIDEIQPIALENLRSLDVRDCGGVTTIAQSDSIEALQNLLSLKVFECEALNVLFELEGLHVTKYKSQSILSCLMSLQLSWLPKLVHILRRVPKEICVFQNLTSLCIQDCDSLRCLFTPSAASSLASLETLSLRCCIAIEEIIAREEEIKVAKETFINKGGGEFTKLVFPKLSTVKLIQLPSLETFCSENIELVFPSLHKLVIANCPVMLKFSSQEPIAPKLKKIQKGGTIEFVDFSNILDPGLFNVEDDSESYDGESYDSGSSEL